MVIVAQIGGGVGDPMNDAFALCEHTIPYLPELLHFFWRRVRCYHAFYGARVDFLESNHAGLPIPVQPQHWQQTKTWCRTGLARYPYYGMSEIAAVHTPEPN